MAETRSLYREELVAFYERVAPEKLAETDEILNHFEKEGGFPLMMDRLNHKYKGERRHTKVII